MPRTGSHRSVVLALALAASLPCVRPARAAETAKKEPAKKEPAKKEEEEKKEPEREPPNSGDHNNTASEPPPAQKEPPPVRDTASGS